MKQNDIIKIFITSQKKKSKDGKKKWIQRRTPMSLIVVGQEEKGKQKKWINVTFCGEEVKKSAESITRGYLHVKVSDINYPKKYEITKDENGKDVYPEVKVFAFESFTEVLIELDNPFITDEDNEPENESEVEPEFESEE